MSKFFLLSICLILSGVIFAQIPQSFQYQAVVRDINGNPLISQSVSFQLSIISGVLPGNVEYVETHTATTNAFGVVTLSVGSGIPVTNLFSDIDWSISPCYMKVEADLGTGLIDMGTTQLLSVPYAMYAKNAGNAGDTLWNLNGNNIYNKNSRNVGIGITTPPGKLVVQGDSLANATDPLFEVKDKDGNSVFVVYQDSVHVYVKDGSGTKSNRGGFAVSGRSNSKSSVNDYLLVTPDSVRIYIEDNDLLTSNRGGFAVSGRSNSKGNDKYYLNVSVDTTETIDPPQNRILWYPSKSAFLTGNVFIESPDSVGTNSFTSGFMSKAKGDWSQALGYQTKARGNYSTSIGNNSEANGESSFAFGDGALALNVQSYAFGSGAISSGIGSYAIGSQGIDTVTGMPNNIYTRSSGMYSLAFGQGSASTNTGSMSFGMNNAATGPYSLSMGTYSIASGMYSTAIGLGAQSSGSNSISIGIGTLANADHSVAFGSYTRAENTNAMALGYMTVASGTTSTALGYFTHAIGTNSMAAGDQSEASGVSSIAMGINSIATGTGSVSMGMYSKAIGSGCFSLGNGCIASGDWSSAFGYSDTASGNYATVMGLFSKASGNNSVAIGANNKATAYCSTALGFSSTASGNFSVSAGEYSIAFGENSSAFGINTYAKPFASFVIGRYNDTLCYGPGYWEAMDPLFIIGNGSNNSARSNAMTVLKNGETYLPFVYNSTVGATNRDLYIDDTGKLGYVSSSKRYKKNICNMENVDWLYQLRPVNYSYKNDNKNRKEYGLIAEEVEKINPLFVSYNNDGTVETVNYSSLIVPLLKALQSQQNEIEELKNKVAEYDYLKTEIEKIKKYQSYKQ